jgi:hypothetical protein
MNRIFLPLEALALLFVFLISTPSTVAAMAGSPPIVLPEGVLDASQIKPLFSGNTTLATVEGKDRERVFFFGEEGQLIKVRNGFQELGTWEVRDDGRLCTDLASSGRDCRIIVKKGAQYQQYAVKKDGDHRYEMTYDVFQKGEHLAKLSKDPILPTGTLKRKDVIELFSGKTVESETATKGRVSHTYYNPDGTLEQIRNGSIRTGRWRVSKEARMCLEMEGFKEKCRIIVKEKDKVKKYIVKKNGQHQHSVSYRNFTPGKTF